MDQAPGGYRPQRTRLLTSVGVAIVALMVTAGLAATASGGTTKQTATIKVGLITKDVTNPFFVKMKAGATAQAKKLGAELL